MTPEQIARVAYRAGFRGNALETAVAVALAESRGNPTAIGDEKLRDAKWGPSVGLWQIRSLNADKGKGTDRDQLANDNPLNNARAAWSVSSKGTSFQPWTMFTNGEYKTHLDAAQKASKAVERDAKDGTLRGARAVGGGAVGRHVGGGGTKGGPEGKPKGRTKPRKGSGGPGRSGRITISIPELTKLGASLGGHEAAVSRSRVKLVGVATELQQLQGQVEDAGPVRKVLATLDELTGEHRMGTVTMPRVGRQLATDIEIVTKVRDLARRADDGSLGAMPAAQVAKVLREAKGRGATASVLAVLEAALLGKLALRKPKRKPTVRPGSNKPRAPKPHSKPKAPAGGTARQKKIARVLAVARKQVGIKEQGENMTKFGAWYGSNGVSWCGMFVSWCFAKAGVPLPDLQKHSVDPSDQSKTGFAFVKYGADALRAKGMLHSKPKAGDIVLYSDHGGHTGIVTSVSADGKTYGTIEGNASDSVLKATHKMGDRAVYGFGRPL